MLPIFSTARALRAIVIATLVIVTLALGLTGCQSLGFGAINAGLAGADASVVYAPDRNLALDVYIPASSRRYDSNSTTSGAAHARSAEAHASHPVVVFFYGGTWRSGRREDYRFVGRRLAELGAVTIVADYRTAPRSVFPGFVEDAAAAVAWAKRHAADYGGDPARVYVAGHSAGAHIAALVGADARYLAVHGLTPRDLAGVIGLSGPYDFEIAGYEDVFGPEAQWPQTQPVNAINGDEPRFLLIHGADDETVEPQDSQILADRLRAAGVEATVLWLPGAGHLAPLVAMRQPDRQPAMFPAIRAFIGIEAQATRIESYRLGNVETRSETPL
jgi:acetyl esterase/lipase